MMCQLKKEVDKSSEGGRKREREHILWGGKPKKPPHLQYITVLSNHPSSYAFLSTEDFLLIEGRNETSKFDRAKWEELLNLQGVEDSEGMKEEHIQWVPSD